MGTHKLHLHSMMVHAVAALAPLAAVAFIFYKQQVNIASFGPDTWEFLVDFSLIVMLIVSFPSILTGIFERSHIYAKWHSTHKIKLVLSALLVLGLMIECILLAGSGLTADLISLFGVLVIAGNNIVVFLLGKYGFKITLGRQSFEKTSYTPDLKKAEPIDILVSAAEQRKAEAKYLDLLTER